LAPKGVLSTHGLGRFGFGTGFAAAEGNESRTLGGQRVRVVLFTMEADGKAMVLASTERILSLH
jgi:hypothetical protein